MDAQEQTKSNRCKSLTKAGEPCNTGAHGDTEFCYFHDPAIPKEVRLALASKGGQNAIGVPRKRGKTPHELAEILADMLDSFLKQTGGVHTAESVKAICEIMRTNCQLIDRMPPETAAKVGWRQEAA